MNRTSYIIKTWLLRSSWFTVGPSVWLSYREKINPIQWIGGELSGRTSYLDVALLYYSPIWPVLKLLGEGRVKRAGLVTNTTRQKFSWTGKCQVEFPLLTRLAFLWIQHIHLSNLNRPFQAHALEREICLVIYHKIVPSPLQALWNQSTSFHTGPTSFQ